MGRLSPEEKLLAIALLSIADDEGYFRADPDLIRSDAFPFSEPSWSPHGALTHLSNIGWVSIKNHPEQGPIGLVVNFSKHQHINRPTASKLKTYFLSESSVSPHGVISESSLLDQGSGIRELGSGIRDQEHEIECEEELALEPTEKQLTRFQRQALARAALHYLNEKAGRHYRETQINLTTICARLAEVKDDIDGVKKMLDRQVACWGTDPRMSEYLRVETLFGKEKFGSYYDNRDLPAKSNGQVVPDHSGAW